MQWWEEWPIGRRGYAVVGGVAYRKAGLCSGGRSGL